MWPVLILSISLASWAVVSSLNERVMSQFADARSESKAGILLFVHDCRVKGACVGGYRANVQFATNATTENYHYSYTLDTYNYNEGYLPLVVKLTENSAICVGKKSGLTFNQVAGASLKCQSPVPAEIAKAVKGVTIPNGAIVLYQKK